MTAAGYQEAGTESPRALRRAALVRWGAVDLAIIAATAVVVPGTLTVATAMPGDRAGIVFGAVAVAVVLMASVRLVAQWSRAQQTKQMVSMSSSLQAADLSGLRLASIHLRNRDLTSVRLVDADLTRADLRGSLLDDARLGAARLSYASLAEVHCARASFFRVQMFGADLQGVQARNCDFEEADLRGASLANADLRGARFVNADLRGADLRGAVVERDALAGAVTDGSTVLPDGKRVAGAALPLSLRAVSTLDRVRRPTSRGLIRPVALGFSVVLIMAATVSAAIMAPDPNAASPEVAGIRIERGLHFTAGSQGGPSLATYLLEQGEADFVANGEHNLHFEEKPTGMVGVEVVPEVPNAIASCSISIDGVQHVLRRGTPGEPVTCRLAADR